MPNSTKPNYTRSFAVVTSLFFMWGFITVLVDSLIPRLREIFELSYFQSGLVQFAFFMAYGLLSIPSGFILARIGYKKGMLLGLATMGIGCLLFWPAAELRIFELFMLGYFVLAGGMTILQVAANPYVSVLGDERRASSRLNLSQAFNSVGTTLAPMVGAMFILSDTIYSGEEISALSEAEKLSYYASEASAVQGPFVVLALSLLALAALVALVKLPKVLDTEHAGSYREALKNKRLMMGALGIFVYVGAEVAIGSYLVNYFLDMNMVETIRNSSFLSDISRSILHTTDLNTIDGKAIVAAFVMFYWGGAMLGRFIGAYLTSILSPSKVLGAFALGAVMMLLISMSTTGVVAMVSILAVGLFNSIMFPTIFTVAIGQLGDLKPQGSGILCTAIVGGAIIPPLYGFCTDVVGFKMAFALLILCYGYILYYGMSTRQQAA
ncbi:MAG: sugar MFS transporter [Flavobacteriales bacterium]|nr:sugar MFS transporter [Flavobacteriales bacterium]